MRNHITILGLFLCLAGCAATEDPTPPLHVYASPAEAFVGEFTGEYSHGYDIPASIQHIQTPSPGHMIDLNGDGVDECFASSTWMIRKDGSRDMIVGASGNRTYYLLAQQDGGWIALNEFGGNDYHFRESRTLGWPDIETASNVGADDYNYVYHWNGSRYEMVEQIVYPDTSH